MEKKSAEEFYLARIEEIKREYYSRLDSIDLSFSILNQDKPPRDYFADFPEDKDPVSVQSQTTLLEEPPSPMEDASMSVNLPSHQILDELPLGHGVIKELLSEPAPQQATPKKDFFVEIKTTPETEKKTPIKKEAEIVPKQAEIKPEETAPFDAKIDSILKPASSSKIDFFPNFPDQPVKTVSEDEDKADKGEEISPIDSAASVEKVGVLSQEAPFPTTMPENSPSLDSKPKDYFPDIKSAPFSSLKKTFFSRFKNIPLSKKPFSFYALLGLGTLILGGIALGILKFYNSSWEYSLPFNKPVGLVALQDQLLSLDSAEKQIYTLRASSGKVLKKNQFVCDNASGFAAFQKEFWCSEADKEDVRRYFLVNGNEYELQRIYQTFGAKIGPIYSDGNYLWGADFASGEIFQYLIVQALTGTLLTPIDRFNIPGISISPAGLYASNGILWVLDAKSWKILRFKISVSKADLIDAYDLKPKMKSIGALEGLSVQNQRIWILTRHPSKIFSFNLGDLPHHLNGAALPQNGANAR